MKKGRRIVTFEDTNDAHACALLMAGQSNKRAAHATNLTKHQVRYRSTKLAKEVYDYPKGQGLYTAWRDGKSWLWKQFGTDLVAVALNQIQSEAPPKLVHPTPRTVEK